MRDSLSHFDDLLFQDLFMALGEGEACRLTFVVFRNLEANAKNCKMPNTTHRLTFFKS